MQGTKKIQKKLINLCVCLCGATPTKNIQFFDVELTPQVHGSESGCAFRSNVTRTSSQRTAPQRTRTYARVTVRTATSHMMIVIDQRDVMA